MRFMRTVSDGFHLIELLIVLAIIAIVATFSVPIVSQHFVKEKRLEAAGMLTKLALTMEEYYIEHNTYENATLALLKFPEFIVRKNYQLFIESPSDGEYMLVAKPRGAQAMRDQVCGSLQLFANGRRAVTGSGSLEECW